MLYCRNLCDAFKKNKMIEKVVLVVNADIVKIGEMLKNDDYQQPPNKKTKIISFNF